jgi:hypothetical protein
LPCLKRTNDSALPKVANLQWIWFNQSKMDQSR